MSLSKRMPAMLGMAGAAALALVLVGCGSDSGRGEHKEGPPAAQKTPLAVKATAVRLRDWPEELEFPGTVKARVSTILSAKVPGYIREIRVSAGDRVGAGQVVATLDARDLDIARRAAEAQVAEAKTAISEVEQGIASAKAQLGLAQATHRRMQDLFEKKSISNQEFDEATARLRVAESAHQAALSRKLQVEARIAQAQEGLAAAAAQRSYAEVVAPFAGIVTERRAEPGTLAAPGMPLLVVEQAGAMRAELSVDESRGGKIRPGMLVRIDLESEARTVEARVTEIVPAIDPAARALTVKADLPASAAIRSGSFVRGRFQMGQRRVLAVPTQAIREEGQLRSVLVADGAVARERLITAGVTRDGMVEILSGLREGDRVISPRPIGVADGSPVEVRGE